MEQVTSLTEGQVEKLRALRDRVYQQSLNPDPVELYNLYQQLRLLLEELEQQEQD